MISQCSLRLIRRDSPPRSKPSTVSPAHSFQICYCSAHRCSCPCCFSLPLCHGPRSVVLCGSAPAQCSHDIAKLMQICRHRRTVWWAGGAVAAMTARQGTTLEITESMVWVGRDLKDHLVPTKPQMGQWWPIRTGQQLAGVPWKRSGIADRPAALQAWWARRSTHRASWCSRVRV